MTPSSRRDRSRVRTGPWSKRVGRRSSGIDRAACRDPLSGHGQIGCGGETWLLSRRCDAGRGRAFTQRSGADAQPAECRASRRTFNSPSQRSHISSEDDRADHAQAARRRAGRKRSSHSTVAARSGLAERSVRPVGADSRAGPKGQGARPRLSGSSLQSVRPSDLLSVSRRWGVQ